MICHFSLKSVVAMRMSRILFVAKATFGYIVMEPRTYRLSHEASTGAGRGNVGSEFAVNI